MKILIGTPVYDEQVLTPYHTSIVALLSRYQGQKDVTFTSTLLRSSLISHARNALATMVLNDESVTHLLFVDADMGFRPSLVEKALAFDGPVTGCVSPGRRYMPDYIIHTARTVEGDVRYLAQDYIGGVESFLLRDGRPDIQGDFVRVSHAGAGIMLIKREVLEAMAQRFPDLWTKGETSYQVFGLSGPVFQPFEALRNPENNFFLGEDTSFCLRWTRGCGGEIWSCFNETIQHVGRARFEGNYEHKMRHEGLL